MINRKVLTYTDLDRCRLNMQEWLNDGWEVEYLQLSSCCSDRGSTRISIIAIVRKGDESD